MRNKNKRAPLGFNPASATDFMHLFAWFAIRMQVGAGGSYQLARPVIQKCMSIKMYEHVTIGDRVLEVGSSGINLKSLLG